MAPVTCPEYNTESRVLAIPRFVAPVCCGLLQKEPRKPSHAVPPQEKQQPALLPLAHQSTGDTSHWWPAQARKSSSQLCTCAPTNHYWVPIASTGQKNQPSTPWRTHSQHRKFPGAHYPLVGKNLEKHQDEEKGNVCAFQPIQSKSRRCKHGRDWKLHTGSFWSDSKKKQLHEAVKRN